MATKREEGWLPLYQAKQANSKMAARRKDGRDVTIKESIHQKCVIYTPNIRAPKYMKQTLMELKGDTNRNT